MMTPAVLAISGRLWRLTPTPSLFRLTVLASAI